MTRSEDDLRYWLRRGEQEAITAIAIDGKAGSQVHREMSRRYSVLAVQHLMARERPISAEQSAH